ncbi:Vacuolar protein-sorting-associated protein 28 [Leucoagaricus gongylophorus]
MARINLDEEVRLYTNNMEREKYNLLATLFGIIVSLEYLERAYVRDSITAAEDIRRHAHDYSPNTRPCLD